MFAPVKAIAKRLPDSYLMIVLMICSVRSEPNQHRCYTRYGSVGSKPNDQHKYKHNFLWDCRHSRHIQISHNVYDTQHDMHSWGYCLDKTNHMDHRSFQHVEWNHYLLHLPTDTTYIFSIQPHDQLYLVILVLSGAGMIAFLYSGLVNTLSSMGLFWCLLPE